MEHVVFYTAADGSPAYRRTANLDDAVRVVEHLRNAEGREEVHVYSLATVALNFRPYYRVELNTNAAVPAHEEPSPAALSFTAPVAPQMHAMSAELAAFSVEAVEIAPPASDDVIVLPVDHGSQEQADEEPIGLAPEATPPGEVATPAESASPPVVEQAPEVAESAPLAVAEMAPAAPAAEQFQQLPPPPPQHVESAQPSPFAQAPAAAAPPPPAPLAPAAPPPPPAAPAPDPMGGFMPVAPGAIPMPPAPAPAPAMAAAGTAEQEEAVDQNGQGRGRSLGFFTR